MRVATIPMEGDAEFWDPADPGPFLRLAGTRYLRAEGEVAVILNGDGREDYVYPGWAVIRPDGSGAGEAIFTPAKNLGEQSPRVFRVIPG